MLGFSLSDYVHSPRAQALPSNSISYKHRVWSFLQTLALSLRYSCSNELNHTSDAAEDHDHGYKLSATELLNLFLSFCPTQNLFLSLSFYSPHHNIVCLLPQTDPSAQKDRIPKLLSSLHSPLHTILLTISPSFCKQKLSHSPNADPIARLPPFSSGSIPCQTLSSNRLVFFFTLPNRHSS